MKLKRIVLYVSIFSVIILFFVIRYIIHNKKVDEIETFTPYIVKTNEMLEDKYSLYIKKYADSYLNEDITITVFPKDFYVDEALIIDEENSFAYGKKIVKAAKEKAIIIPVEVSKAGLYSIHLDYYYDGNELLAPKFSIKVNDEYQFYESHQLSLPINWEAEIKQKETKYQNIYLFESDRYHNDIQPKAKIVKNWNTSPVFDNTYMHSEPLLFYFNEGYNEIKFISNNNYLYLGKLALVSSSELINYEDYISNYQDVLIYDGQIVLEAEYYKYKSDPSIKLLADKDPASTPYDTKRQLLNAIDPWTWDETGRYIVWEFTVPQDALYKISFKYIQYRLVDIPAYRKIEIDGQVLFKELKYYPFHYSASWRNETLHNENGDFYFYLTKGKHTIKLTSVMEPYIPIVETIESIMSEITDLALEIKKLTGGKVDKNRDWELTEFIPNISDKLNLWAEKIYEAYCYGNFLNDTDNPAAELVNLKIAAEALQKLAKNPNEIPNKMTALSEGTQSVQQYLGDILLRLIKQSMGIEKIYLHDNDKLPSPKANIFVRFIEGVKKFFLSFTVDKSNYRHKDENTIEVWINRPRANMELMQKMIDEQFTPMTGIKVNLSLMPDQNKLILANASGIEPDVAMGISNKLPYEFAIRGAAVDFRQFDGYEEIVANYANGILIPYVYEDGLYGLPETQDFRLTYYRTDILGKLDIPIPQTWKEVIDILPELQRYGMNYYVPLGGNESYKSFALTTPFYYQIGAELFSEDGHRTAIDSELGIQAMKLMTDLYVSYDLPKQVPNFYNHFRYSTLPIGIGGSGMYLQLLIAAPEIKANWSIALHPGVENEKGEIIRYAPVPSSGIMMFNSSKKQQQAFTFIKWWLSTETQIEFSNDIQTMFGKEYMWFSANINALQSLPLPDEHLEVILEQLNWAVETPNVPGGYYLEREISDAWNKIVFDEENVRSAIDEAVINANRELMRKMIEFGYIVDNKKVKDYKIPTLKNIDYWLTERK